MGVWIGAIHGKLFVKFFLYGKPSKYFIFAFNNNLCNKNNSDAWKAYCHIFVSPTLEIIMYILSSFELSPGGVDSSASCRK